MMDPIKGLTEPAGVHAVSQRSFDAYGEEWVVIDGIETKVPRLKQARALLERQDKVREEIRAELDALGLRETVETEMMIDGELVTVQLLPKGDTGANALQIGKFPDAPGLFKAAEDADAKRERDLQDAHIAAVLEARKNESWFKRKNRTWMTRLKDGIETVLRKATK